MVNEKLKAAIDSTAIYYDQDHPEYVEDEKVLDLALPFMEWECEEKDWYADGVVYLSWTRAEIRLYTDTEIRYETEHKLQKALRSDELTFTKKREFLPELMIWQTTYTMEV